MMETILTKISELQNYPLFVANLKWWKIVVAYIKKCALLIFLCELFRQTVFTFMLFSGL
jgi:hypothetical protein